MTRSFREQKSPIRRTANPAEWANLIRRLRRDPGFPHQDPQIRTQPHLKSKKLERGTHLMDGREHGVGADRALQQLVHAGRRRAPARSCRGRCPRRSRGSSSSRRRRAGPGIHLGERAACPGGGQVGGVEREAEVGVVAVVRVGVDVVHVHGGVREGEALHAVHVHGRAAPCGCRARTGAGIPVRGAAPRLRWGWIRFGGCAVLGWLGTTTTRCGAVRWPRGGGALPLSPLVTPFVWFWPGHREERRRRLLLKNEILCTETAMGMVQKNKKGMGR